MEVEVELEMADASSENLSETMALHQARVQYLGQNDDYLSDLEDLKSFKKLQILQKKTIAKLHSEDNVSENPFSDSQDHFESFKDFIEKANSLLEQIYQEINGLNEHCIEMLVQNAPESSWSEMTSRVEAVARVRATAPTRRRMLAASSTTGRATTPTARTRL